MESVTWAGILAPGVGNCGHLAGDVSHLWQGLGLLAWGTVFVNPLDDLIRWLMMASATRIPFLLSLFGVLGGLRVWIGRHVRRAGNFIECAMALMRLLVRSSFEAK